MKILRSIAFSLALLVQASPALAGAHRGPAAADLTVDIASPSGVTVYDTSMYDVVVSNVGKKTAAAVELTIDLPLTHTSPQVYVLGVLGGYDGRCSLSASGHSLVCALGSMAKSTSTTVSFDIDLPQSSAPLWFEARVTTSSAESSTLNNTDVDAASLLHYAVPVVGPVDAVNEHCTGTGLTSFFECELFPSSISSHSIRFEAGGSITILSPVTTVTGIWSQPASDRLTFTYYDGVTPVATFHGYGVSPDCFEGLTTFPGSPYVSPYSVCLQ